MSSAEYEIKRLEDKISDLQKKLEENTRLSMRIDSQEQWEFDRLRREFDSRKRRFEETNEKLRKELQEIVSRRDRTQYKMDKEKEEELEESDDKTGRRFNN